MDSALSREFSKMGMTVKGLIRFQICVPNLAHRQTFINTFKFSGSIPELTENIYIERCEPAERDLNQAGLFGLSTLNLH